jgi:Glycosyl hydrolase family 63 C-terminal domain
MPKKTAKNATKSAPQLVAKTLNAEQQRLADDAARKTNWKRWGPYLSERQWATVREDYSPKGECWDYFPHDHARSRAYRWGEDGLLGFTDRECRLCFGLALWNGRDPILKERLFGLTGPQGNHGEDAKECWWYHDSTPTHSWVDMRYKYPQAEFPYEKLRRENQQRGRDKEEYELLDSGIFDQGYWDIVAQYAKADANDTLIQLSITNRGSATATLTILPTWWFRNTWSWGSEHEKSTIKPHMSLSKNHVIATHETLGDMTCAADVASNGAKPTWIFTENETNNARLFGGGNASDYVKDAFHRYVINHEKDAVNPVHTGTKAAACYQLTVAAGETVTIALRLRPWVEKSSNKKPAFDKQFQQIFAQRKQEADEFYHELAPANMGKAERHVARRAYAGMLCSKQFYHYVVKDWLDGDPAQPPPPASRKSGRNADWKHLFNRDVISMPDKWEYPWYAAWDLAFHCIPLARVDVQFAKDQLLLFLREWYMHPNGQIPAYEFALGDVNPPVHAWACWRVYRMTAKTGEQGQTVKGDIQFLERTFQKLLINFTWWVNRKDVDGKHLFAGGFLGLDNIGVFDRSKPLPGGATLEQADGTAWMAFYAGRMLTIALELAKYNPVYEDIASKFFEHYVEIADAINHLGGDGLWDDRDGFYYDKLNTADGPVPLRIRSMVGLIPLIAVEILDTEVLSRFPSFSKRLKWFVENRTDLSHYISWMEATGDKDNPRRLLALSSPKRLLRVLKYVLDESEFLSPHGVRSLSLFHKNNPFIMEMGGETHRVDYDPGESTSGLFGGNSNWRGPVWFPINYLLIESLERYYAYYGPELKIECPTGSGVMMDLGQVARELSRRLGSIFLPDQAGKRPCHGGDERLNNDPHWKDLVWFHEYFHGDTGKGLGANHQTGWTGLAALCLERLGDTGTQRIFRRHTR